jgi:hypothetical protein
MAMSVVPFALMQQADFGAPVLVSFRQSAIARRAATLCVWCEAREAEMASGADIDIPDMASAGTGLFSCAEYGGDCLSEQAEGRTVT